MSSRPPPSWDVADEGRSVSRSMATTTDALTTAASRAAATATRDEHASGHRTDDEAAPLGHAVGWAAAGARPAAVPAGAPGRGWPKTGGDRPVGGWPAAATAGRRPRPEGGGRRCGAGGVHAGARRSAAGSDRRRRPGSGAADGGSSRGRRRRPAWCALRVVHHRSLRGSARAESTPVCAATGFGRYRVRNRVIGSESQLGTTSASAPYNKETTEATWITNGWPAACAGSSHPRGSFPVTVSVWRSRSGSAPSAR